MKNIDNNHIKELLIAGSYISEEDAKRADDSASEDGISFVDALLRDGVVNSDIVGQATAESRQSPQTR